MTTQPRDRPNDPPSAELAHLRAVAEELRLLETTGALLYIDDRVARPEAAAGWRARQRAAHAAAFHVLATSDRVVRAVAAALDRDATCVEALVMQRDLDRRERVPSELWVERADVTSVAAAAWSQARRANDAAILLPELAKVVDVMRRVADAAGYEREPYEACLREWEPGIDVDAVERCFEQLDAGLAPVRGAARRDAPASSIMATPLRDETMVAIEQRVLRAVGWDPTRGRLERDERAFCISLGPDDVRMATRFHQTPGLRGLHSTLHEAGHAVYAQALGRLGVPATLADAPGLGMDEAQARMLENAIGRSRPFVTWLHHQLVQIEPDVFAVDGALDSLRAEVASAEHPLRRLGADEPSYDQHIAVRFDLERAIINGQLPLAELPAAWADAYEQRLGARPASDADGCLQDVHWSLGQWGYFPTYTLGNVYGAQLLAAARRDLAGLDDEIEETGDTARLRSWMDEHVYRHGRSELGATLVARATGAPLDVAAHVAGVIDRAGGDVVS